MNKLTKKELCDKWLQDKTVNPETKRKIKENGDVYKELAKKCLVKSKEEVKSEEEIAESKANILDLSELDIDYLAKDDLQENQLASSELDINTINADFLGEDFLDNADGSDCVTRDNTKLCGTTFGLNNTTQITTILSGDYLRLARTLSTTVDIVVKKDSNKTIFIDSNGKSFLIEINEPAGGTIINVKQSE